MLKSFLIPRIGALILRALLSTIRWKVYEIEKIKGNNDWGSLGSRVIAIWHGHQILLPTLYFKSCRQGYKGKVYTLISKHRDGRIAADLIKQFGIESVAGSSTRGGAEALHELVKKVTDGNVAVITPDGPKGPIYKVKSGVVKLAQLTGAPILPVSYAVKNPIKLKSWDQMIVPKPFSIAVCLVGESISIPSDLTEAEFNLYLDKVEDSLNELKEKADNYFV